MGVEESGYDWLYSDHDNELWGAVKTVYDPCPKGWKVPDKDVYADFMIGDDHDQGANGGVARGLRLEPDRRNDDFIFFSEAGVALI